MIKLFKNISFGKQTNIALGVTFLVVASLVMVGVKSIGDEKSVESVKNVPITNVETVVKTQYTDCINNVSYIKGTKFVVYNEDGEVSKCKHEYNMDVVQEQIAYIERNWY